MKNIQKMYRKHANLTSFLKFKFSYICSNERKLKMHAFIEIEEEKSKARIVVFLYI